MTKRISIRGQGADIFFERQAATPGDGQPPTENPKAGLPDSKTARQTASKNARQEARPTDRHQQSKTAFTEARPENEPTARLSDETKRRLRALIRREHRVHNTFRYAREELAAVRDIVYELEVRWGRKVTRNDVMRAALNWIIEDFREKQGDSLLAQLLEEEEN